MIITTYDDKISQNYDNEMPTLEKIQFEAKNYSSKYALEYEHEKYIYFTKISISMQNMKYKLSRKTRIITNKILEKIFNRRY